MAQYRIARADFEDTMKRLATIDCPEGDDTPEEWDVITVTIQEVPEGFSVELVREEGSQIAVEDLEDGDMVDLHNDPWADAEGEEVGYEFEYAQVDHAYAQETGVLVYFRDGDAVTFPVGHTLKYGGRS